jgi:opacity protein-like surface antigen
MAKLPHTPVAIALLMMLTGCVARAQNSDLGLLLGFMGTHQLSGPGAYQVGDISIAGQINYAYQLKGWPDSGLYLEIPLLLAARNGISGSSNGYSSVGQSGVGGVVPGVRFKLRLGGRASLYGAAGAGIGWVGENGVFTTPGTSVVGNQVTATAAFDFGGGLDLRLTKLLSLRGEARDLVTTTRGQSGAGGHNNGIYTFGFAFHF